jgi:putative DNA primase/helicase
MDSRGNWREWAMPMYLLKGNGDELLGELLNQGFIFDRKKRSLLIDFIMNEHPKKNITAASRIGWHGDVFVLPNNVIGGNDIVFQTESAAEHNFKAMGSLDDWNRHIGMLCEGNTPLMVSVSTALAGSLLHRINKKSGGGVHWTGDSSTGKSTTLEVTGTVWGSPEIMRSWSVTANGLESAAAMHNDTCLILDEIGEAHPQDVGKISYMITNGQGKQRAGRSGNARQIQRWRLTTISSGEKRQKASCWQVV